MSEPEQRQPTATEQSRDDDNDDDDGDQEERPEAGMSTDDVDEGPSGPPLPEELLAEARAAFAMFSDGGGDRMNVRHLYMALRALGVDATDEDVIAVVDEYDPKGRGYITRNQWTASMARRWAEDGARRRRFRAMLAAGDPTYTGQVTVDHVRAVLNEFDPTAVTAVDVDEMVTTMDFAGIGMIDYDDFMDTMVRPAPLDRYL
ncbi:troponin C, slow skeletal and cardiac muscles-like [Aphis craccivora]|uniref:Troponin C, slow skeletal and cardiac muscles-like n=1 Tax=Aphis craccivora TaxID=307492 RepID=A0A6G0Z2B5_APHCR|nr:troponin C, slow skeletal and cardiac muscles-like [Aphis craccivora]